MKALSNRRKGGSDTEDKEIVALYWRRDPGALTATAEQYGSLCRGVARRILQSEQDAEECLNDTLLRAWDAIPPQRPERLGGFLAKITRNLALSRLRKRDALKRGGGEAALALEELDGAIPSGFDLEKAVESRELSRALNRFLSTLPQAERDLFVARYWFLATVPELSRRTGFGQTKVKAVLRRCRSLLREFLKEEGYC